MGLCRSQVWLNRITNEVTEFIQTWRAYLIVKKNFSYANQFYTHSLKATRQAKVILATTVIKRRYSRYDL